MFLWGHIPERTSAVEEATFLWSVSYMSEDCAEGRSTVIEDLGVEFNKRLSPRPKLEFPVNFEVRHDALQSSHSNRVETV